MMKFFFLLLLCASYHSEPIQPNGCDVKDDPDQTGVGGAAGSEGLLDIPSSKYFLNLDAYNLESCESLHILPEFKTYQQTSEFSCGVACAVMAMNYLGNAGEACENVLFGEMETSGRGTSPEKLTDGLNNHTGTPSKYFAVTNANDTDRDEFFEDDESKSGFEKFKDFVINAIDNNEVLIMLSNDWGGHYEIIIGYDDMGNDYEDDDVLIVADPYDTTDHNQDGYTIWSAWRFYSLWHYTTWTYYDDDYVTELGIYSSTYIKVSPLPAKNNTHSSDCTAETNNQQSLHTERHILSSTINPDSLIERKCSVVEPDTSDTDFGGAAPFQGKKDIDPSPYYAEVDAYSLQSNESLHILPQFKTYQQSSDFSCGVACAIMAMNYVNKEDVPRECDLYLEMGTSDRGTDPAVLADVIAAKGYNVVTNAKDPDRDTPFEEFGTFRDFVIDAIDKGEVLIMLSNDWGGHYEIIIGYDTIDTDYEDNDVIIMADPYDTTDHRQDGYTVWGAWRFYSLWHYTSWTYYDEDYETPLNTYSSTYIKVVSKKIPSEEKEESAASVKGRSLIALFVLLLLIVEFFL